MVLCWASIESTAPKENNTLKNRLTSKLNRDHIKKFRHSSHSFQPKQFKTFNNYLQPHNNNP